MAADVGTLEFLFDLACRAPEERLLGSWRDLRAAGQLQELQALAGSYGLVSALACFAERLPAEDLDRVARQAVAAGLRSQHGVSAVLQLLEKLCRTSEVLGREAIAIKGAALILDGLYDRERDLCDADVLVRESDLVAWRAAAERVGARYVPVRGEAHELAYVTSGDALVELHAALPATVAFERGPGFDTLRPHARPPRKAPGPPGLLVVAGEAAAEVAVHHFAFHHGGLPVHALRTLQDLRVLGPDTGSVDLLPWGSPSPRNAVIRLNALAHTFAAGGASDPEARRDFVLRLAAVQNAPVSADTAFSDSVRRWIFLESPGGPSAVQRVVGRLVPSRAPDRPRSLPSLAGGIAQRFVTLSARFARGLLQARASRRPFAVLDSWRSFLNGPLK